VFIDQGANLEAIVCPACGERLEFQPAQELDPIREWWYGVTDPLGQGNVAKVEATMPCCQAVVPFATLQFEWPAGIASFEVSIMNLALLIRLRSSYSGKSKPCSAAQSSTFGRTIDRAAEQGDEADEAGASDGASQLIPGVRRTHGGYGQRGRWLPSVEAS
jgi:hypothetical protein